MHGKVITSSWFFDGDRDNEVTVELLCGKSWAFFEVLPTVPEGKKVSSSQ
jgi:hypothetical protein